MAEKPTMLPPVELPEPEPAPTVPEEKEERDYAAELRDAVGSPASCLQPRSSEDAPSELAIDLEAYVMPSGGVGRAYARSSQLSEAELDCIRRRLEATRLAPPIEDAPRRVNTTVRLELQKPENPSDRAASRP